MPVKLRSIASTLKSTRSCCITTAPEAGSATALPGLTGMNAIPDRESLGLGRQV